MSRAPVSFKERDLTRAIRAANKAGLKIKHVEVDKSGRIVVVPVNGGDAEAQHGQNDWDKALEHEGR
jgi:hypothetical protein